MPYDASPNLSPLRARPTAIVAALLRDWLLADHLAYFVADVVEELDLQPILHTYGDLTRGTVAYDPRMLGVTSEDCLMRHSRKRHYRRQ